MTVASLLSHLAVGSGLFYKINEKKLKKKINNDLAVVASQIPGGAIHDKEALPSFFTLEDILMHNLLGLNQK